MEQSLAIFARPIVRSSPVEHIPATRALFVPTPTTAALRQRRRASARAATDYPVIGQHREVHCLAKEKFTGDIQQWLAIVTELEPQLSWEKLWARLWRQQPTWFDRYWLVRCNPEYPNLPTGDHVFAVDELRVDLGTFTSHTTADAVKSALVEAIIDAPDMPIYFLEPLWEKKDTVPALLQRDGLMKWKRQQQTSFREHNERYAPKIRRAIRRATARARRAEARRIARLLREGWQLDSEGVPFRLDPILVFRTQEPGSSEKLIRKIAHW